MYFYVSANRTRDKNNAWTIIFLNLGFCRFLWVVPIKTNVENAENSNVVSKINLPWRLCGHPEKTAGVIREIIG